MFVSADTSSCLLDLSLPLWFMWYLLYVSESLLVCQREIGFGGTVSDGDSCTLDEAQVGT